MCLNGAASRCVQVGDRIILMSYCIIDNEKAIKHRPKVVFVNKENKIEKITSYEKHGEIIDI